MFRKTRRAVPRNEPARDAGDGIGSSPIADPITALHGGGCRCEFCSKKLKDDRSISLGYGPVCARKHNIPWRGADDGEIETQHKSPSGERRPALSAVLSRSRSVLRRVRRAAVARLHAALRTARSAVLRQVRGSGDQPRRGLTVLPGLRSALPRVLRAAARRRAVLAVACAGIALTGLGAAILGWLPDHRQSPGVQPARPPAAGPPAVGRASRIAAANQPAVIPVHAGSAQEIAFASAQQRRDLGRRAAGAILAAVEVDPRRLAVIHLRDVALSFEALPIGDQRQLESRFGEKAAERYELAVADLLEALIQAVERQCPRAVLSVLGLPVEPEEARIGVEPARRTNERYRGVIDRLGPFVPARRFVVFGSSLDEGQLARMGMRETLRLREGRPVVFRTNVVWRALVDDGGPDYQEYLVAAPSGEPGRGAASRGQDGQATELQALIADDP